MQSSGLSKLGMCARLSSGELLSSIRIAAQAKEGMDHVVSDLLKELNAA